MQRALVSHKAGRRPGSVNRAPLRQRVSAALLLSVCLFAVAREFGALAGLAPLAGAALLGCAALEWRRMAGIARLTVAAALVLAALLLALGLLPGPLLTRAIERSAFFALFVTALDVLRAAAMTSPMILRSGRTIVSQPPGRRYAVITLGAHLFAMLLNVGTINLLGTMNRRSIEAGNGTTDPGIREIRLRRMTLALLRGFTSFTLWAPTSVTVVVVLSAVPDLDWIRFAPMGIATAGAFMLFGWLLDRLSHPRTAAVSASQSAGPVLRALLPLLALSAGVLAVAALLAWATGIRAVAALLVCVPLIGSGWITLQYARAGAMGALILGRRRIIGRVLPDLVTLRSEVSILGAAGFIAVILPAQIPPGTLGPYVAGLGLTGGGLLVAMLWAIPAGALVGFSPIVSVAIAVELLAQLSGFAINPYALALAGTLGWALATGSSPFGTTIRLTARSTGRPATEVGLRWNRAFSILILVAGSVIAFVFA